MKDINILKTKSLKSHGGAILINTGEDITIHDIIL